MTPVFFIKGGKKMGQKDDYTHLNEQTLEYLLASGKRILVPFSQRSSYIPFP